MTTTERDNYVAGLRALADLLDDHPELPLPNTGRSNAFDWWIWDHDVEDPKATLAEIVRLIPGAKNKVVGEAAGSSWFTVEATLRGLRIDVNANRATVCQRVVTGTREVVEEVPDPDALAAVPTVSVTKTVEDFEWVCEPLLATREQVSA